MSVDYCLAATNTHYLEQSHYVGPERSPLSLFWGSEQLAVGILVLSLVSVVPVPSSPSDLVSVPQLCCRLS